MYQNSLCGLMEEIEKSDLINIKMIKMRERYIVTYSENILYTMKLKRNFHTHKINKESTNKKKYVSTPLR